MREELGVGDEFLDDGKMKKYEGLLEKKWTSVVRLQKKVRLPSYRYVHRWHSVERSGMLIWRCACRLWS